MKKLMLLLGLLLFAGFVSATAPTVPSTLSPVNNSIYFNDPTLTCSGSTDAEGDDINYLFYYPLGNLVQNSSLTTYNFNNTYIIDNFNRADSGTIGNGWVEVIGSNADFVISNNKLKGTCTGTCDASLTKDISNISVKDSLSWNWNSTDINGAGNNLIKFYAYDGATECFNIGLGGATTEQFILNGVWVGSNISANTDYFMTIQDIDFDAKTFNVYANGIYQSGGSLSTCNQFTSLKWLIGSNDGGVITAYMDDLEMGKLLSPSISSWNCQACDNNTECSSLTSNLTFNMADFSSCTSGNMAQQFNLLNETGSEELGTYNQDCQYTLSSSQDTKTYNFALSGSSFYSFCLDPLNVSVTLNGFCEYDSTNSDYSFPRQYYFDQATLNGGTLANYSLYQLEDGLSTAITFSVTEAGVPLENRIIQIQRYDIATGNYRTVSMLKTDVNGQDISYLEQTTAFYKVCVFESGNSNPVFCSSAFHLTGTSYAIALTTTSALTWSSLAGVGYNLTFDTGSDQWELTYSDPNEKTNQFCLRVYEDKFTGRELVNNNCLSANSGTIQVGVTPTNGTSYSAYSYATLFTNSSGQYSDDEYLLTQGTYSYGLSEAFTNNGLFFVWLLVAIFSLLAFYSPSLALLLAPLPVVFGAFSGILAIPMGTAFALYLGFIVLAVIVGGRR